MRRLPVFVLALLMAFVAVGCDSNDNDDLTETEILIGSWTVVEVSDDEGDKTDVFESGINDFSATLEEDGEFDLAVDFVDEERTDIPLQGTYEINEGTNSLILHAGPAQLPFTYDIETEDRVDLSISDVLVEGVFGTQQETYVGEVTFTIERD